VFTLYLFELSYTMLSFAFYFIFDFNDYMIIWTYNIVMFRNKIIKKIKIVLFFYLFASIVYNLHFMYVSYLLNDVIERK